MHKLLVSLKSYFILNLGNCSPDQFVCSDYSCINVTQVCDGVQQCYQNEDEMSCCKFK